MCYSCFFSTQEQAAQYDNKSFSNYVKDAEREKREIATAAGTRTRLLPQGRR